MSKKWGISIRNSEIKILQVIKDQEESLFLPLLFFLGTNAQNCNRKILM